MSIAITHRDIPICIICFTFLAVNYILSRPYQGCGLLTVHYIFAVTGCASDCDLINHVKETASTDLEGGWDPLEFAEL